MMLVVFIFLHLSLTVFCNTIHFACELTVWLCSYTAFDQIAVCDYNCRCSVLHILNIMIVDGLQVRDCLQFGSRLSAPSAGPWQNVGEKIAAITPPISHISIEMYTLVI